MRVCRIIVKAIGVSRERSLQIPSVRGVSACLSGGVLTYCAVVVVQFEVVVGYELLSECEVLDGGFGKSVGLLNSEIVHFEPSRVVVCV